MDGDRKEERTTMAHLMLTYPEGLEHTIQLTPEELEAHIRLMAAIKMFELGKLSSGKAAELAGLARGGILGRCSRYQGSLFNYPPELLEAEVLSDVSVLQRVDG